MENWKDVVWYEGIYYISDIWNIRNNKKYMSPVLDSHWYMMTALRKDGKSKPKKIHRLVAEAFIPNPDNKPCINHKNWIRNDNRIENLERVTYKENIVHAVNILKRDLWCHRWKFWINHNCSKQVNQYTKNGEFIRERWSLSDIKRELWYNADNISRCCKWKHKYRRWFIWKYKIKAVNYLLSKQK